MRGMEVERAGMALHRELHWSGVMLDIIWRPNALVPALEVEFLNSFSLSIGDQGFGALYMIA